MAIDPNLLAQVLGTPNSCDVMGSPIIRAVILSDPANAADLVPALDDNQTLAPRTPAKFCVFSKAMPSRLC